MDGVSLNNASDGSLLFGGTVVFANSENFIYIKNSFFNNLTSPGSGNMVFCASYNQVLIVNTILQNIKAV